MAFDKGKIYLVARNLKIVKTNFTDDLLNRDIS